MAAMLQGISINRFALTRDRDQCGLGGCRGGGHGATGADRPPTLGHTVIINGLIVIIVGGVGSISGAVVAAVFFSFFHTFITTFTGGIYADIFVMLFMLFILVVKPTGIMGRHEKV